LRKEKNYSDRKFISKYPNKNWNRHGLDHLIKQTDGRICESRQVWDQQTANCRCGVQR